MKAALYARFSTEKQSEASIEDQFRVCERIAAREHFQVVARFSDAALSGGTAQRPEYQRMLAAARRHEFDVIIAEDSSRLWRELAEQWRSLKELSDLGVHVVGHGLDTRREESKILLAVSGAMAEAYRDEISRRTRRGLEGRALASRPTGGRAFGYIAARDTKTGCIEIDETDAPIVRRIFSMYADGASPRTIAATLNAERVPSPGSKWNRTVRRKDGHWLASTINGDVLRGSGILNNRRYVGCVVWGRSLWKRGAADSSKRRMSMMANPSHEYREERLRIVPQDLWDRVKALQKLRSKNLGARVKGGLRRRAPGGGRPPRYLLSGLLRCGVCDAGFTMSNGERYSCASHINGRACSNALSVRKSIAEARILNSVKADLRDPAIVAEVESRFQRALNARRTPAPDSRQKIDALQREIENVVEAIASGLLKSSPVLAQRLATAEEELARLQATRASKASSISRIAPNVAARYLAMIDKLEDALHGDPERSRAALVEAVGPKIVLEPDQSGRFLWAVYELETVPLLAQAAGSEIMVAGAGFEPATFGL